MEKRRVRLYALSMIVALIGLGDSIYLTVQHLTGRSVRCTITSTCSKVLGSAYATLGGIPTAAWGAIAYLLVFSLATMVVFGYPSLRKWLAVLVAAMATATLGLLFLQAFVIRAWCEFCLLSAAVTLTLAVIILIDKLFSGRERLPGA